MTTRRGFLLECLALGAAPAVVRASSIMPVVAHGWARPGARLPFADYRAVPCGRYAAVSRQMLDAEALRAFGRGWALPGAVIMPAPPLLVVERPVTP